MANEQRLIDANALLSELQEELEFESLMFTDEQNEWMNKGLKIAVKDVKHQPTVDAVPVVRCKDCKNWVKCESSLIGEVMCCTGQGSVRIQKAADDFCSYGERREGE